MKSKNIRNTLVTFAVVSLAVLLIIFTSPRDGEVVRALPSYESRVYKENGEIFGARMKYGLYQYEKLEIDTLLSAGEFSIPDVEQLATLKACVKDYMERVDGYLEEDDVYFKTREFALNCMFFSEYINESDYCIVELTDEYYSIYYYKLDTETLYYMYAEIDDPIVVENADKY